MCLTCGCMLPYDDMGDPRNVTFKDIKEAVETPDGEGLTTDQAVQNLIKTWSKVKDEDKKFRSSDKGA